MKLSAAMSKSPLPDPFEAAYAGAQPDWERAKHDLMSIETTKDLRMRGLHHYFPHLGQSVRRLPKLAEQLEKQKLIPRIRAFQMRYRQAVHVSLWGVIAALYGTQHRSKQEIIDLLAGVGL